jgi:hypothetical protein
MHDSFPGSPLKFGERRITKRYPHLACLVKALEAAPLRCPHTKQLGPSWPVDTCRPGTPIVRLDKDDIIYRDAMYSLVEE